MPEIWSNDAATTLAAPILAGDTTITVTNASKFPPGGNFRIRVGGGTSFEYLMVTGRAGAVFTVTRAIEGSTALAQSAGVPVTHVLTAGSVAALGGGGGGGGNVFVYRDSEPSPSGNVYPTWATALAARAAFGNHNPAVMLFDDTLHACTIPAGGPYEMNNTLW